MTELASATDTAVRREVSVRGVVQGVGFRPFVYGLAGELGLAGHVTNTGSGVLIEVEGAREALDDFCARVRGDAPALARVETVEHREVPATGVPGFSILTSRTTPAATLVPPDTATCADCLAELADPGDRRHRHPFITCTNCGPRFTIVTGLPYDRDQTTMAGFPMCESCEREYHDPGDRRFHAQPISCHDCGPRLRLLTHDSRSYARPQEAEGADPVAEARRLLADGAILAVKGIGGYHLACDAAEPEAVALLRRRKARGAKPFALMARDLAGVSEFAELDDTASELLTTPARPIVLLRRRPGTEGALAGVAPGLGELGFMLPYTPLHHLLLGLDGDPAEAGPRLLVMTSANISGEPLVFEDEDALDRLAPLVDGWLTHDRPIHVPCDDSVLRVCDGAPLPVRRSRGYVPLPLDLPGAVQDGVPEAVPDAERDAAPDAEQDPTRRTEHAVLAVGGDLKNTLCVAAGGRAWLSAHVGDMDAVATRDAFERAGRQLTAIAAAEPDLLAADLHPGYRSTQWAERDTARPCILVQHHHAHVASAMAEQGLDGLSPVIGVAFDGTGYGTDGAVWGGEVLLADYRGFRRFAHLSYVPLPGGDSAVQRPYRMALAHLTAAGVDWSPRFACVAACPPEERRVLARQLERGLNCVPTSSMGRLFDAVSALIGICQESGYEAQAAMELEAAAARGAREPDQAEDRYRFGLRTREQSPLRADPAPLVRAIVADLEDNVPTERIAFGFHTAIVELVADLCETARERHEMDTVVLSGGVFGNTLLSSGCARRLEAAGFRVLRHRLVPPNDGGLALGQAVIAAAARHTVN